MNRLLLGTRRLQPGALSACGLSLAILFHAALPARAAEPLPERFRPVFHFTAERNWLNDPNGLVFYKGEYHLFYQYNPFGNNWGHMSWGHAVSRDLVHWQPLPLALAEGNGVMIFSGSAVVDWDNTSQLGTNGQPPLVAIYTGHYTGRPLQNQNIAFSNDRGRTWTKFPGNPVLDIGEREFRDPKVFWHQPTRRWVMTVALPVQRKVRFYSSTNLKQWEPLSDFGPMGASNGVWECPDLFPLSLAGSAQKTYWVLTVNVSGGAPAGGSEAQYFVGQFDGHQFTPAIPVPSVSPEASASPPALWVDLGPDCYAAVSWNDIPKRDGRRLWLGWMSNTGYAGDTPTSPWRSAMTLPRELGLRQTAAGLRLTQQPARELEKLRSRHWRFHGGSVADANDWLHRNTIRTQPEELLFELGPATSGKEGVKLYVGNGEETVVGVDREQKRVFVDRTRSGNVGFHGGFAGVHYAPLAAAEGRVQLHIFIDACSIEVFVNKGEQTLTELVFPSDSSRGLEFFGRTASTKIKGADAWLLE